MRRKTLERINSLSLISPDAYGKRYDYWLLKPGMEGYIVGDCGAATRRDCEQGRIAVRAKKGYQCWYILCPEMHAVQHAQALALIRSQAEETRR